MPHFARPPWLHPEVAEARVERSALGERINVSAGGRRFISSFIVPGVVSFRDGGGDNELLPKETIDEALNSLLDSPLTINHPKGKIYRDWNPVDVGNGKVDKVSYNARTAWYECEGTVDTEQARERFNAGDRPSCGYSVLETDETPGTWANVPYARKLTKIRFHHLALVARPRYEEADIRLNGIPLTPAAPETKTTTSMFKLIQKILGKDNKPENRENSLTPDSIVTIDGKKHKVSDLLAAADAMAKEEAERFNEITLTADSELEHDGKKLSGSVLIAAAARLAGSSPAKTEAERENERKAKEEAEKKERESAEAKERENAKQKDLQHFANLSKARENGTQPVAPSYAPGASGTIDDGCALGRERYGSKGMTGRN